MKEPKSCVPLLIVYIKRVLLCLRSVNPCPPFLLWQIGRALTQNIRPTVQCTVTFVSVQSTVTFCNNALLVAQKRFN
jgi:hypothetical protein